ncbi:heteromeric transposase endonuclease subunit TnsA [Clostridium bovifaecis]|uniref:Heteromeric transposase endonuclease subunit TnsA n=1 Tax=Clostridium bovifaecis TaxID=2184719 RepID=A0A6I6EZL9_9CLOT|nr:heteromeric transposase endonuclease subunit TnsA [Clostridium bovifaecis]
MAKRKLKWNEDKRQDFIEQGRGNGIGADYKPWLNIQDFPSMGRVSRVFGWKTKRIHHLFTDIQTRYFYLLEWEDSVLDIREHFPLLDIDEVIKEKDGLDFALFTDRESKTPYVISTTFLITVKDKSGIGYIARSIKAAAELEKKSSLEKAEIERRYWEAKEIDWGIVTQKDIPVTIAKNIEWIHSSLYDYKERGFSEEDIIFMSSNLMDLIYKRNQTIKDIITAFERDCNYEAGTGLYVFKYLIASKQIRIDMEKEIDINNLVISPSEGKDFRKVGGVIAAN